MRGGKCLASRKGKLFADLAFNFLKFCLRFVVMRVKHLLDVDLGFFLKYLLFYNLPELGIGE